MFHKFEVFLYCRTVTRSAWLEPACGNTDCTRKVCEEINHLVCRAEHGCCVTNQAFVLKQEEKMLSNCQLSQLQFFSSLTY